MAQELSGEQVARRLGLEPLPEEGGLFRETLRDGASTAIYYLLIHPDFSALHRVGKTEVLHHYAGDPVAMLRLQPDGSHDEPVLGPDLAAGQHPQIVVPAGVWQGSSTVGSWSLLGATVAPPFELADFATATAGELIAGWPDAAGRIHELTRS